MDRVLDCENYRRFGVEIELNTLDGFVKKLDRNMGEIPLGADLVALIIRRTLRENVEIQGWDHNFNNNYWIVKPDSSCGMEVCSPVLKGWIGLSKLIRVVEALRESKINADKRCSLHVHVNISDLNKQQLASVIAWYIKCEHLFIDSVPVHRKINRYCQILGMSEALYEDFPIIPDEILNVVSNVKYYSLNAYHFMKGGGFDPNNNRKKTIEFRIAENDMCLNGLDLKNWVRFLIHFVEVTKSRPLPAPYQKGDPWTGLVWLDPVDVFKVLNFDEPCSEGFSQVKKWFLNRILKNGKDNNATGIWSDETRNFARQNFLEFLQKIDNIDCENESREVSLYGKKYIN